MGVTDPSVSSPWGRGRNCGLHFTYPRRVSAGVELGTITLGFRCVLKLCTRCLEFGAFQAVLELGRTVGS